MKKTLFTFITVSLLLSTSSFAADSAAILASVKSLSTKVEGYKTNNVNSGNALEMVKSYANQWLGGDTQGFKFVENASSIATDANEMGTTDSYITTRELSSVAEYLAKDQSPANLRRFFTATINDLSSAGASFGYNAAAQNGCAAPTYELLVIDPTAQKVYSLDMMPCHE